MKWLTVLSVPKVLTVLCLLGLGINGLVQVGLQKDMAAKADRLRTQVATAQQLSGQMKGSLGGLTDLQKSTQHMQGTLHQLAAATADMNQGLALLSTTVNGISASIQNIGDSTQVSKAQIGNAQQASAALLLVLQETADVNRRLMANLSQMMSDQTAINANLAAMNRKTQMLP